MRQSEIQAFLLGLGIAAMAACGGGSTTTPTPTPTPAAPTLSCPASFDASSQDGQPVPVSYATPVASGGQSPVVVTCTAASATAFPVGSSIVTCTATDALTRQASCNFNVTVTVPPRIAKTSFLAFGDSITFGRCGLAPATCPPYTERLEDLLTARYATQTFTVRNEGLPGERADEGQGRLTHLLDTYRPEVLLLMEGTNNLSTGSSAERLTAIDGLDGMLRQAVDRGITVLLATIAPARAGGNYDDRAKAIPDFNEEVRLLAARRNVTLVDVFAALNADIDRYVGADDLHPTEEGLRLIGETFYDAIRNTLDTTPTTSASRR